MSSIRHLPLLVGGILTLPLLLPRPLAAAEQVALFDPEATKIEMLLEATGHNVEGTFALEGGEIRFDLASGAASGELRVQAASGVTGNEKRDRKMREEVLETEQFPWIVFTAERIETDGDLAEPGTHAVDLVGTFAIHGTSHPLTLGAEVTVDASATIHAHATFEVPFVEWGMEDPSVFVLRVAKRVRVTIDAVASLAPGQTAEEASSR